MKHLRAYAVPLIILIWVVFYIPFQCSWTVWLLPIGVVLQATELARHYRHG